MIGIRGAAISKALRPAAAGVGHPLACTPWRLSQNHSEPTGSPHTLDKRRIRPRRRRGTIVTTGVNESLSGRRMLLAVSLIAETFVVI